MTYETPCQRDENDPDDWFIGQDGKQYGDDEFVTEEEAERIAKSVLIKADETPEDHQARVAAAVRQVHNARRRDALARRRRAKQACGECYFRTNCLDQALRDEHHNGTWGGYFEEELRQLRLEISRRKRRRSTE